MTTHGDKTQQHLTMCWWFFPALFLAIVVGSVTAASASEWTYWGQPRVQATVIDDREVGYERTGQKTSCRDMHEHTIIDETGRTGYLKDCGGMIEVGERVEVQWPRSDSQEAQDDASPVTYVWIAGGIYAALMLGVPYVRRKQRQHLAGR